MKFNSKFILFHSRKCIWKLCLQNGNHLSRPQYVSHKANMCLLLSRYTFPMLLYLVVFKHGGLPYNYMCKLFVHLYFMCNIWYIFLLVLFCYELHCLHETFKFKNSRYIEQTMRSLPAWKYNRYSTTSDANLDKKKLKYKSTRCSLS